MASLPLSTMAGPEKTCLMAIGYLIFFLLITLASIAGKVADTRDSADWKPSDGGFRHTT